MGAVSQASRRYYALDGIRGIAAVLVAAFHFGLVTDQLVPHGYLAVDLFFVLSGFVIALNYTARLAGGWSKWELIRRRIIRLYPLYLIGLALGISGKIADYLIGELHGMNPAEVLFSSVFGLFMLPTPILKPGLFPLNPPAWSLMFEMLVNILFACLLFQIRIRYLVIISTLSAIYLVWSTDASEGLIWGWTWTTFDVGVARTMLSFPIGVIIWRLLGRSARRYSWWSIVFMLAAVCLMLVDQDLLRPDVFDLIAVTLVFPALIALSVLIDVPGVLVRLCDHLGKISYAIYAIHYPLIAIFSPIYRRLESSILATGAFLLFVVMVATLSAYILEKPVRKWLELGLGRLRKTTVAAE